MLCCECFQSILSVPILRMRGHDSRYRPGDEVQGSQPLKQQASNEPPDKRSKVAASCQLNTSTDTIGTSTGTTSSTGTRSPVACVKTLFVNLGGDGMLNVHVAYAYCQYSAWHAEFQQKPTDSTATGTRTALTPAGWKVIKAIIDKHPTPHAYDKKIRKFGYPLGFLEETWIF